MAKLPLIKQMTEPQIQTIAKINKIPIQFFRDLIWLLYVPSISRDRLDSSFHFSFAEEEDIELLLNWLTQKTVQKEIKPKDNLPLGKYAERLITYFLNNHTSFKLLAHNLQIIADNRTIGELDFLFEDLEAKEFIHLEFAIKYYLKVQYEGEERFLGPSTKDWYKRKLQKLCTQQAKHTQKHSHLLPIELQNIKFESKIMVKGALFYPYKEWLKRQAKQTAIEGWWLGIEEIEQLVIDSFHYVVLLNKRDWVFPFSHVNSCISYQELIQVLNERLDGRNELMVVRYGANKQAIDIGFVVRKAWPN